MCPYFYDWFLKEIARELHSLYEKQVEKRNQVLKKESIMIAVSGLQKFIQREENDETRSLYGFGKYLFTPEYKKFQVPRHIWHSWNEDRR